ncbi:MAG: DEAD/DEAH box helicase [Phototrophicaceae bacterium]
MLKQFGATMTQTFQALGLVPPLLETLNDLGYEEPTPIQLAAIPLLLAGRDVMGQAQTGTGKTAAFTLPTIQQLQGDALEMLILTPTRELAIQVSEAVYRYGSKLGIKVLPVYGGQSYERQERRLRNGVNVVVGTPGRTLDLIRKKTLKLQNIRFMILDEADEMLKMGFIDDVEEILSATDKSTRQTLLFSATFSPPIRKLAKQYMNDPEEITIKTDEMTNEDINQRYYMVNHRDKIEGLSRILEFEDRQNTLIFTRTRVGSAQLAETLVQRGFPAIAIHGDLAQNERERILNRFRSRQLNILVATDVVGRGVDIPDVSHVINYDIPQMPIEYVHRIGRTGRAGRSGEAITFITSKEKHSIKRIEKFINHQIFKAKLPTTDDILKQREDVFMNMLVTKIKATTEPNVVLDELVQMGFPAEQIATALIDMLAEREFAAPVTDIADVKEHNDRGRGNGERNGGPSRRGGRKRDRSRSADSHEEGMVRLAMDVGRKSNIRPGDVVYAIASSANIPGKSIGAITINTTSTYVDVPEQHVEAVLRAKNSTVKGQRVNFSRS